MKNNLQRSKDSKLLENLQKDYENLQEEYSLLNEKYLSAIEQFEKENTAVRVALSSWWIFFYKTKILLAEGQ